MCDALEPSLEWVAAMKERLMLRGGALELGKTRSVRERLERAFFG